jgi:hypothetical protein
MNRISTTRFKTAQCYCKHNSQHRDDLVIALKTTLREYLRASESPLPPRARCRKLRRRLWQLVGEPKKVKRLRLDRLCDAECWAILGALNRCADHRGGVAGTDKMEELADWDLVEQQPDRLYVLTERGARALKRLQKRLRRVA